MEINGKLCNRNVKFNNRNAYEKHQFVGYYRDPSHNRKSFQLLLFSFKKYSQKMALPLPVIRFLA